VSSQLCQTNNSEQAPKIIQWVPIGFRRGLICLSSTQRHFVIVVPITPPVSPFIVPALDSPGDWPHYHSEHALSFTPSHFLLLPVGQLLFFFEGPIWLPFPVDSFPSCFCLYCTLSSMISFVKLPVLICSHSFICSDAVKDSHTND
jgi:hypothetical protein